MNRRDVQTSILLLVATMAMTACQSSSEARRAGELEPPALQVPEEADSRSREDGPCVGAKARAIERLDRAATRLHREFNDRYAEYCDDPKTCRNPRYTGGKPGQRVPTQVRTFPGGTDYRIATSEAVPKWGDTYEFEKPTTRFGLMALYDTGLFEEDRPTLCFRYVYQTGPGVGRAARVTLKAVVDLDPSDPDDFTLVREVSVDDRDGRVEEGPLLVLNRGK